MALAAKAGPAYAVVEEEHTVGRPHVARRALLAGLTVVLGGAACFCAMPETHNLQAQTGSLMMLESEAAVQHLQHVEVVSGVSSSTEKPDSESKGKVASTAMPGSKDLSRSSLELSTAPSSTMESAAEPDSRAKGTSGLSSSTSAESAAKPSSRERSTSSLSLSTTLPSGTTQSTTVAESTTAESSTADLTTAEATPTESSTVEPTTAGPASTTTEPTPVEPTPLGRIAAESSTAEPGPGEQQSRSIALSSASTSDLHSPVKPESKESPWRVRQQRLRDVLASAAVEVAALCIKDNVAYVPLDMPRHDVSYESSLDACQVRCAAVEGCETFTFFPADKSCHVQDGNTAQLSSVGAQSGRPTCDAMAFKKL